ncbi:MAG: DUF1178 family protein [Arenicella sp.]|nr:DUF1178 family protein [Arenicella sp.]
MVIYDLICDSRHEFEGWFNNSDDLVSQQEKAILRCPVCDSLEVSKKVTAPKLFRKSNSTAVENPQQRQPVTNLNAGSVEAYNKLQGMLTKVHEYIDSNFKDVGNKFADEALSMHRGDKELNNIRGTATANELKGLAEEGVTALPLPDKPVDKKKLN